MNTDAYLIDTNILLRSIEAGHSMQPTVHRALQHLTGTGASLCVTAQNMIEFWAVATRPVAVNGLGLTPSQAATELANFKATFHWLADIPAIFSEWERISAIYQVSGKQVHDARIVAVMKSHAVARILTFNIGDFTRFATGEGIVVVDPGSIVAPDP